MCLLRGTDWVYKLVYTVQVELNLVPILWAARNEYVPKRIYSSSITWILLISLTLLSLYLPAINYYFRYLGFLPDPCGCSGNEQCLYFCWNQTRILLAELTELSRSFAPFLTSSDEIPLSSSAAQCSCIPCCSKLHCADSHVVMNRQPAKKIGACEQHLRCPWSNWKVGWSEEVQHVTE